MKTKRFQLSVLALLLVVLGAVVVKQQAIHDWWRLRGYNSSADISALVTDDTMTPEAQHLFYVNHPTISSGSNFASHCPAGSEKTVVLGCYVGNDRGIYLYQVTDPRLGGVEQVTAAHEMLHAAYRRLSAAERQKIDTLLTDYYQHDLTDQRLKDTIAAYQKSEPNDVVNEMHSVFGTEVADLPGPLEQYYKQYFTDRAKVAAYTAGYQEVFTSRRNQITGYDAQLKSLKQQIDSNQAQLSGQKTVIETRQNQLQAARSSGQVEAYNAGVASYNQAVNSYNALLVATRNLISQYNSVVSARNTIVLEEQQLTNELSANTVAN